ncbi:helicase-associated domain-containing protein [Paenibacillus sp.]|uniref:helicase-associated domain-containing protein n=1 Tax=Paenibacillus sp. TaxID=58172 RepID=UPI002810FF8E|nr:helicase-associated domain-containing protein [Paenibacillus sp.]
MNELTTVERKTLEMIVLRFAEEPFGAEALERAFPGRVTGFEAELGLERLRARGIVETRRKAWGETIHALAPGLFADWQGYYLTALGEPCLLDDAAVEPNYEPKAGFAKLLLFFLADVANVGIGLTQKGTFAKKDAMRLATRVDVAEESLAGLDIAYLHQDKLGKPLAVLYDAALRLGLVRNGASALELDRERVDAWLAKPLPDIEAELRALWWDVYTPSDVWLQHGGAALRRMPPGRWFAVDRAADGLLAAGVPTGGRTEDEAREAIARHWLRPLAAFGFAELGSSEEGLAARMTAPLDIDEEETGWYVQPDFELIVPPTAPFRSRWELEACAEYAGGDAVDRYRITKASWERALASGRDAEALLEVVRSGARYGVPEPVEAALRQWSAAYGALTLEDVTLLRCRNAEDAAYLKAEPSLSECFVAQIGELDFIVRRSMTKTLADALKRQGFSLRAGGSAADAASNAEDAGEAPARGRSAAPGASAGGIVHSRRNAALFPLDPAPAGTKPLRERLSAAPQAWLRSMRKYHASTVRDLMETAIDARTSVRLVMDGREVELVPKRVMPAGTDWIVQGYIDGEETTVASSACGEAQLLVPEQA